MDTDEPSIVLSNYRRFPKQYPVRLQLEPGLTALLGPNNSGKSSLLRYAFDLRNALALMRDPSNWGERQGRSFGLPPQVTHASELFCRQSDGGLALILKCTPPKRPAIDELRLTLERDTSNYAISPYSAGRHLPGDMKLHHDVVLWNNQSYYYKSICAMASDLEGSVFIGASRTAMAAFGECNYFDLPSGAAFQKYWSESRSGAAAGRRESLRSVERDIARIFGLKNVSLHKSDSVADMFVEHDGGSYRLHDMGHGLSHFVQVLTLVALRKPPFIFIDEPEIGLHPTLQMDFLLALASHATKGVFFATHHYALARAVADRVLCVVPEEDGTSRMSPFEETERLSTFLGGLDYAGHRQLGCRGVLLVEGATDVRLVRQALTTLGKARDIAIVPLGGSQMIRRGRSEELAELKRLSESLCVLIDSERSSEADSLSPDRAAFKTDCEQLGIPCHVLCLRASDNYLTGRALAAAFGSEISPLGPFEKHGTKAPCWPKCDGWKAARQMTREEWAQSDLGVFLSSL